MSLASDRVGFYRDGDLVSGDHADAMIHSLPDGWVLVRLPTGWDFYLFKKDGEKYRRYLKGGEQP